MRKKILNDNCNDTGCSLKVFDKDVFMEFPFFNGIHRFLPALFKGYGKNTFFLNVDHRARIYGYSKYGIFLRLVRGIKDLIKVNRILKEFRRNRG
jgi:dolichol-phosphate mannosyltransferase